MALHNLAAKAGGICILNSPVNDLPKQYQPFFGNRDFVSQYQKRL
jgi:hypothetical protein